MYDYTIPKQHHSGKRKFLEDKPIEQNEHFREIEELIQREAEEDGENNNNNSGNYIGFPKWSNDGKTFASLGGYSQPLSHSSINSYGSVTSQISRDEDGLLVVKTDLNNNQEIPVSHRSTVYNFKAIASSNNSSSNSSYSNSTANSFTSNHNNNTHSFSNLPSNSHNSQNYSGLLNNSKSSSTPSLYKFSQQLQNYNHNNIDSMQIDDNPQNNTNNLMRIDNLLNHSNTDIQPMTTTTSTKTTVTTTSTTTTARSRTPSPTPKLKISGERNPHNTHQYSSLTSLLNAINDNNSSMALNNFNSGSLSMLSGWVWVKNKQSIVLIGPVGIGKSFLINTLLQSSFIPHLNTIKPVIGNHRGSGMMGHHSNADEARNKSITQYNSYDLLSTLKSRFSEKVTVNQEIKLDDEFLKTYDWGKEKESEFERIYITSQYLFTKTPSVNDMHTFILPQGRVGPAQHFKFSFGAVCGLIITFLQESELRNILWELHQHFRDKSPIHTKRLEFLKYIYSLSIHGFSKETNTILQDDQIKSSWDLPIRENIKSLLGKKFQFNGLGKDHNLDRVFIREKMKQVLKDYSYLVGNIHIKMPCSILLGNREIHLLSDDTKRGNVSKFNVTRVLDDADQILLAVDYRGISADLADLMIASKFPQKFTLEGSVQLIELGEPHQNKTNYPKPIQNSKHLITNQLFKLFKDVRNITNVQEILSKFNLVQVMPLLYSSIHINKSVPSEYKALGFTSIKQLEDISNVPLILRIMQKATQTNWTTQHNLFDKFKKNVDQKIQNHVNNNSTQNQFNNNLNLKLEELKKSQELQQRQIEMLNQQQITIEKQKVEQLSNHFNNQLQLSSKAMNNTDNKTNSNNVRSPNWRNNYTQYHGMNANTASSGIDRITTSFRTRFAGWKRKLLANVSSEASESIFLNKSSECEQSAVIDWDKFKIISPDYITNVTDLINFTFLSFGISNPNATTSNSNQNSSNNLSGHFSSGNYQSTGKRSLMASLDYYQSTNNPISFLCKSIITWAPNFWRENIVDRLPLLEEEITTFSRNLLSETSKLILNKINLPNDEKLLHMKMLVWCQSATDRNIRSKIGALQIFLNQNLSHMIFHLCLETFNNEISNLPMDHNQLISYHSILEKCFHSVPFACSARVQQKLIDLLRSGLTYLDAIEKHLEHTIQYLLNSPFRLKRQQATVQQPQPQPSIITNIDVSGSVIENYINLVDSNNPNNKMQSPMLNNTTTTTTTTTSTTTNNSLSNSGGDQMDIEYDENQTTPPISKKIKSDNQSNMNNSLVVNPTNQNSNNDHSSVSGNYFSAIKQQSQVQPNILPPQTVSPLVQLCISKICQHIHTLTNVRGTVLPEEIIQKIITFLIQQERIKGGGIIFNQLDDLLLSRLLNSSMQSLDLDGARLVTSVSLKTIASTCPSLRRLSLANCTNISSEQLQLIATSCKQLECISLKSCHQITNPGVVALARGCPNLCVVDLSGCTKITDSAVHELIHHCKQLHTLDLRRCVQLTDSSFQAFNITTLVNIDLLECNFITDASVLNICNFSGKSLNSIKLSGKGITDLSLKRLAEKAKSLLTLELVCENITDQGVQVIGRSCPLLHTLNLCSSKGITSNSFLISDETDQIDQQTQHYQMPSNQISTTSIHSSTTSISNVSGSGLTLSTSSMFSRPGSKLNWNALTYLDLNRCIGINDSAVLSISNQSPLLETISLAWCVDISDESVITIAQRCQNLKNIDLTKCNQVTDTAVLELAKHTSSKLNRLVLYSCTQVTDSSIIEVATQCNSLIHLDVSQCEKITDSSLLKIAQGLRQLRVLCMEECVITDAGVCALGDIAEGQGCPYLEVIKLGYCRFISDQSLLKLSIGCQSIVNLDISYCSQLITPRAIRTAIKSWSKLHTLRLRGYLSLTSDPLLESIPIKLKTVNLSWCGNMDDNALVRFVKNCPALESLDISRCTKLTDLSLEAIFDNCRSIRMVNVAGCKEITPFTIQKLSSLGKSIYR